MTKQLEGLCTHTDEDGYGRLTSAFCPDCAIEADLYQPNKQVDWKVEDVCIHGLKLGDTCAACDLMLDDPIDVELNPMEHPKRGILDHDLQYEPNEDSLEEIEVWIDEEITAQSILQEAINAISDRAPYRDANGKKTFELASEIFSKVVGHDLDEHDACMFLACVKLARSQQGEFHVDDFVDASAYISLAGEARARQVRPARKGPKMGEDMP